MLSCFELISTNISTFRTPEKNQSITCTYISETGILSLSWRVEIAKKSHCPWESTTDCGITCRSILTNAWRRSAFREMERTRTMRWLKQKSKFLRSCSSRTRCSLVGCHKNTRHSTKKSSARKKTLEAASDASVSTESPRTWQSATIMWDNVSRELRRVHISRAMHSLNTVSQQPIAPVTIENSPKCKYFSSAEKEFTVGKHLEIEMEFKTSELSGILLSTAEPPLGSPSLSIEVYNGKVNLI